MYARNETITAPQAAPASASAGEAVGAARGTARSAGARRWLMRLAGGALLVVALSGCRTAPVTESKFQTYGWEEHRLPNAVAPYDKLLVEIDAVRGAEPTAAELADLRTLLEQATNKPGGVTIKVDNIIPASAARGRSAESLALEYLNGPTDDRTAFIYILCYRSGVDRLFGKGDNPRFTYFPYPCAVFVDRSFSAFKLWYYHATMQRYVLRHEVGHALGLARNPTHSAGGHCTDPSCIMWRALVFNFRRWLTFRPPLENTEFCAACRRDLEDYKLATTRPGERLWHGYFVRSGTGYHVLTLPAFIYVQFGELDALTPEMITEARRAAIQAANTGDLQFGSAFSVPNDAAIIARFVAEQKDNEVLQGVAEQLIRNCVAAAEAATDPDQMLLFTDDLVINAAASFPELQARLKKLRARADAMTAQGNTSGASTPRGN